MRGARVATAAVSLSLLTACSGSGHIDQAQPSGASSSTTAPPTSGPATPPAGPSATSAPPAAAAEFRTAAAMSTVRRLAGRIGPRETTSPAFREAAVWVQQQLQALGYDVRRQPLRVPAGRSWGVPVGAGRTWNVIATPHGLGPRQSHLVVGAHLDTVPQAPGAEDNASGIGVLLETARLAARSATRLPVVFVAFAGEEPRGVGEAWHHFGSRTMVARMTADERQAMRGMVALDRVGVGGQVPICDGSRGTTSVVRGLRRAARGAHVPTTSCGIDRASDHWSFEQEGFAAARVGSTPYAQYHSAGDQPSVVQPAQLGRVGAVLWTWLTSR